jgi:hypothetical protein
MPLLATAALLASTALGTTAAHAVDGTWTGADAGDPTNWNDSANWTSAATPDGTATFTTGATGTTVASTGVVDLSAITFTAAPNAPAYTRP